jgi:hypothetical protein
MKGFKWVIQSNQIKDFPVTVQHIDVAQNIWGKNIAALKGKITRSKSIPVARDYVKVPMELMELHQGGVLNNRHILCQQDSFLLDTQSKNMLHGSQSSRGSHDTADIRGF